MFVSLLYQRRPWIKQTRDVPPQRRSAPDTRSDGGND